MSRTWAELTASEILAIGELDAIANNSVIYKNNSGVYSAITLGANGTVLTSNGTTSAPTFQAAGGGIPTQITVANEATDTTCFPLFVTAATGDLGPKTNAGLTFDSSTATLSSTILTGTTRIKTPEIVAISAAGIDFHNHLGQQVAIFGAGGSVGSSFVGPTNIGTAAADYIQIAGGTGTVTQTATGSSTNIDLSLVPKGTGAVKSTTGFNAGVAGGTTGYLKLNGTTSGTVTIQTADAAGTYTLTLPTNDGDASQVLTTNGSGVLSWATPAGGVSWGSSLNGASGTGLALALDNSYAASGIGQSITIGNTQSNALKAFQINGGTSTTGHTLAELNMTNGKGIFINCDPTGNPSTFGLDIDIDPNNAASNDYWGIRVDASDNLSTGYDAVGIGIVNRTTTADLSNNAGIGLFINQVGVGAGATALYIKGAANQIATTNGLFNMTLNNTQSGATVMQKIDLGTSAQGHTGLQIRGSNNSASVVGILVNQENTSGATGRGIKLSGYSLYGIGFENVNAQTYYPDTYIYGVHTVLASLTPKHIDFQVTQSGTTLANRTAVGINEQISRTGTHTTGTVADNYDLGYFKRTSVQNGAGGTLTAAGSVLKLENVATQTAGTLTDTVDVLNITQDNDSTGNLIKGVNGSTSVFLVSKTGTTTLGAASIGTGALKFNGTTSGTVTLTTAAAAGTWTMTLPTTGGTSGYFLQTDGSGTTTWAAATSETKPPYFLPYATTQAVYTRFSDTPNRMVDNSSNTVNLRCDNLAVYRQGTNQSISKTTINANLSTHLGSVIVGGYAYIYYADVTPANWYIYRALLTADWTSAGSWTQITISGGSVGTETGWRLIGYDGTNFIFEKNTVTTDRIDRYSLSGTTFTHVDYITCSGADTANGIKGSANTDGMMLGTGTTTIRLYNYSGTAQDFSLANAVNGGVGTFATTKGFYRTNHAVDSGSDTIGSTLIYSSLYNTL